MGREESDPLYTVGRAAKYLGVSRQRIYELLAAGRFGERIGGVWFVRQSQLDSFKSEREGKNYTATLSPRAAV